MRGKGTQAEPYVIETDSDFYAYLYRGSFYKKTYFKLGCNIDLTNLTNKGIAYFSNVYLDGDGYEIKAKITEISLGKIDGMFKTYLYSLFDYFVSSELHNIKIDLTIDADLDKLVYVDEDGYRHFKEEYKQIGLAVGCGLIGFADLYEEDADKNIIENSEININYIFKKLYNIDKGDNAIITETALYSLGRDFKPYSTIFNNITVRINSNGDGYCQLCLNNGLADNTGIEMKGDNYLYYGVVNTANNDISVTIFNNQLLGFNNTYINSDSEITVLELFHNHEIAVENRNFTYKGTFKTLDIQIDNTDNMNATFRLNVTADRVRNLSFKRDNFISNINDTNNIDIFTPVVDNLKLEATKRLDGYIDIHGGVYKNIYYKGGLTDGDEATLIYLNEGSITYEDTIIKNDYDKKYSPAYTEEIWYKRYSDLHFKDMNNEYIDYIDLYLGDRWVIIPLYETGDIVFYISKTEYKYMRVDENKDVLKDEGLKIFVSDGTYKDGKVIKTLPHPDR